MEQTNVETADTPKDLLYTATVYVNGGGSFEMDILAADTLVARGIVDRLLETGSLRWQDSHGDIDKGDSISFDPKLVSMVRLRRIYPATSKGSAA